MAQKSTSKSPAVTKTVESGSKALIPVSLPPKIRTLRRVSIQFDGNGNNPVYQLNIQLTNNEVVVVPAKPMSEISFTNFWGVLGKEIDNALDGR